MSRGRSGMVFDEAFNYLASGAIDMACNVIATDDESEVVADAGTIYEGAVIDVEAHGAFEMVLL